ncbi:integrase [Oleiphilus messinensis]|uniref:Integrase n=1 Tax=Oleiphilus messinensis TaxID=141451 RepID=A0A1Y0I234_9GAMM|nr:site-specific integrase [Oleiphilus messinensis]ARU54461.1 integrase [Oleiphilus messinensis]
MDLTDTIEISQPGLLAKLQKEIKAEHLNSRTEQTYQHWITRYIFFNELKNPSTLNEENIKAFLVYLVTKMNASKAKVNQAKQALEFLYLKVLKLPLSENKDNRLEV